MYFYYTRIRKVIINSTKQNMTHLAFLHLKIIRQNNILKKAIPTFSYECYTYGIDEI